MDNVTCSYDSNDSVFIRLIRTEDDLRNKCPNHMFPPEFTHQIFGQSEVIFGYTWITIIINMTATKLITYVDLKHGRIYRSPYCPPDQPMYCLSRFLRGGYLVNKDAFKEELRREKGSVPPGEFVYSAVIDLNESPTEIYIFCCNNRYRNAKEWMANMQILSTFFIETAVPINFDNDSRWHLFALYERQGDDFPEYFFVGFATVYEFYCHPNMIRPRISQFVILPPFRRQGVAPHLLQGIYVFYRNNERVKNITAEITDGRFIRIRDFVDCRDAMKLNAYAGGNFSVRSRYEFVKEVQVKLKLGEMQCERIFEILIFGIRHKMDAADKRTCDFAIKKRILWEMFEFDKRRRLRKTFIEYIRRHGIMTTLIDYSEMNEYQNVDILFSSSVEYYLNILKRVNS